MGHIYTYTATYFLRNTFHDFETLKNPLEDGTAEYVHMWDTQTTFEQTDKNIVVIRNLHSLCSGNDEYG